MAPSRSLERPIGSILRAAEDTDSQWVPIGCKVLDRPNSKYVLVGSTTVVHNCNPLFRGIDGNARAYICPSRKKGDERSWAIKIVVFEVFISSKSIEFKEILLPVKQTVCKQTVCWLKSYMDPANFQVDMPQKKWIQSEHNAAHRDCLLFLWEQVADLQLSNPLRENKLGSGKRPLFNQDDEEEDPIPIKAEASHPKRESSNKRKHLMSPRIDLIFGEDNSSTSMASDSPAAASRRRTTTTQQDRAETDGPAADLPIVEPQANDTSFLENEHFEHLEMLLYAPVLRSNGRPGIPGSRVKENKAVARRQWARFNTAGEIPSESIILPRLQKDGL